MRGVLILALTAVGVALAVPARGAAPAYTPGPGDFMTAYVEPHHLKLWYAGEAGNWALAAYEADELGETFDDVATYQADWEGVPIAQLIEEILQPALERTKSAIEAKDPAQFKVAYTALTSSCNACHTAAKKPFIVVKVPTGASTFTDQDFAPH